MNKTDNSKLLCDFGEWIRKERERQGFTQTEVGEKLGLHQAYYSRIESGKRVVDFSTALNICKVLELDISDFVKKYIE